MTDKDLIDAQRDAKMAAHDEAVLARLARGEAEDRPAPHRNAMLMRDMTGTTRSQAAVRRFARGPVRRRAA